MKFRSLIVLQTTFFLALGAFLPALAQSPPPLSETGQWFAAIDGRQAGPFSAKELAQEISEGRVGKKSLVWIEGMENWEEAGKVKKLDSLFQKSPPPLPDVPKDLTVAVGDDLQSIIKRAREGTVLRLEKGYYGVPPKGLELVGKKNLTIIGGKNVRLVSGSSEEVVMLMRDCEKITLRELFLTHDPKVVDGHCIAGVISIEKSSAISLEDCHLDGCGAWAISMSGSYNFRMVGGQASNNSGGVFNFYDSTRITISGVKVSENYNAFRDYVLKAVTAFDCWDIKVVNNQFLKNRIPEFTHFAGRGGDHRVETNYFEGNDFGTPPPKLPAMSEEEKISRALQVRVDRAVNGDVIRLRPGKHFVPASGLDIRGKRNLTILGEPGVQLVSREIHEPVVNVTHSDNITLKNLHIVHEPLVDDFTCMGGVLNVNQSFGVVVENCHLDGCGAWAVGASEVAGLKVSGGLATRNSAGVFWMWGSRDVMISGVEIRDNYELRDGGQTSVFSANDSQNVKFINNIVKNNKNKIFSDSANCKDLVIEGNQFSGNTFPSP